MDLSIRFEPLTGPFEKTEKKVSNQVTGIILAWTRSKTNSVPAEVENDLFQV